jgi:SAM-dependent methyltransferase
MADAESTAPVRYWNQHARRFSAPHPRLVRIGELVMSLPVTPRDTLDVGCGPGALKQLLPSSIEYFGIDIAPDLIAEMHDPTHFQTVDLNLELQCFRGRQFDLIVCSGIFEYMTRPSLFVRFLVSRLRAGGHLVLTYANRHHYQTLIRSLTGRKAYIDPHSNFISIPAAVRLLSLNGLAIRQRVAITRRFVSPPLFSTSIHFPFNLLSRQFIFLCALRGSPGQRACGKTSAECVATDNVTGLR